MCLFLYFIFVIVIIESKLFCVLFFPMKLCVFQFNIHWDFEWKGERKEMILRDGCNPTATTNPVFLHIYIDRRRFCKRYRKIPTSVEVSLIFTVTFIKDT